MGDLDELAAAGRAKREAKRERSEAAKSEAPKPQKPAQSADERRRMYNAVAFNTVYASLWTMIIGSFVWLAVGMLLGPRIGLDSDTAGGFGGGLAIAWGLVWFWGLRRLALALERKWWLARPYETMPDRMFRKLGKARETTKIVLRVAFRGPVEGSARKLLRDAGEGVHPDAKARFEQGELLISAKVSTKRKSRPGSSNNDGDPYQNEKAYAFIRTVMREGVEVIHAKVPVEAVRVELR